MNFETIWWEDGAVKIIDQTKLPNEYVISEIKSSDDMFRAIKVLAVRGAPLIGVSAAFGLYLGIKDSTAAVSQDLIQEIENTAAYLASSRPTAVNLCWALERMKKTARDSKTDGVDTIKKRMLSEAQTIKAEDAQLCGMIGECGQTLIHDGDCILTHCNAGALATAGIGTALAPVYSAQEKGKKVHVFVDETRPLLQGARLTAWELTQNKVVATLICDNMAGSVLRTGKVQKVIVGADRIAANGDMANKIGTYPLAVLARHHDVPFYVAAPYSTFDFSTSCGEQIPIEERIDSEVRGFRSEVITPKEVGVFNPAFDVTPADYITAFITEKGICYPPFEKNLKELY